MPFYKSISIPDGLLAIWKLSESIEDLLNLAISKSINLDFLKEVTNDKRKAEKLATRILLQQMIGSNFRISYTQAGKPQIEHAIFHHISISHSRDYVAIIVHRHDTVGLDIESIHRNYNAIEKKYLSEAEQLNVRKDELLQCFYWCAKEAIFKLVDEEGIDFTKQIQIEKLNPGIETFKARFICKNREISYQLHQTTFDKHGLVWVCGNSDI